MSYIKKQSYTIAMPDDASIAIVDGKRHATFKDKRGKLITAPMNKSGRVRMTSQKWYAFYALADGTWTSKPLCENKTAAQVLLAELVRGVELEKMGILDRYSEHRQRPLVSVSRRKIKVESKKKNA